MNISEKTKKIVYAVNASRANLKWDWSYNDTNKHIVTRTIKQWVDEDCEDNITYPIGQISSGGTKFEPEYVEMVCTAAEYIKCISEMERAEWMGYRFVDYGRYKEVCISNNIDTSNKTLLKSKIDV